MLCWLFRLGVRGGAVQLRSYVQVCALHLNPVTPMSRCSIHPRLNLWATEGSYVLEPASPASSEPSLVINRRNGQLTLQPFDAQVARMASPVEVRGIMGILTLTTSAPFFLDFY